jgi:hypothetical protein
MLHSAFHAFYFSRNPLGKKELLHSQLHGSGIGKKLMMELCVPFLFTWEVIVVHLSRSSIQCYNNLRNQPCCIEHAVEKQSDEDIRKNRLRVRTSIDAICWLAFQACSFQGHDESHDSMNQGNFFEMIKLITSYNEEVKAVILCNALKKC